MGLYQTAKRFVPLSLKESFHKHKSVPKDVTARVTNRLSGGPAVPPGKTTHGKHYLPALTAAEQEQFRNGELVVREQEQSGSNLCAVFHPSSYVKDKLMRSLSVVDFIECGAKGDSMQDGSPAPQADAGIGNLAR